MERLQNSSSHEGATFSNLHISLFNVAAANEAAWLGQELSNFSGATFAILIADFSVFSNFPNFSRESNP